MVHIQTRQQKNLEWWCNGTVDGYDMSFDGFTMLQAQEKMRAYLIGKHFYPQDVNWESPIYYPTTSIDEPSKIRYQKVRIDHNPHG